MSESDPFNARDGEEFIPNVPNLRKRKPERVGQPSASRTDDIGATLDRIVDDITKRYRMRDGNRWR